MFNFFLVLFCSFYSLLEKKSTVVSGEPNYSLGSTEYPEHNSNLDTVGTYRLILTCRFLNLKWDPVCRYLIIT